jgi:hypothetical protein
VPCLCRKAFFVSKPTNQQRDPMLASLFTHKSDPHWALPFHTMFAVYLPAKSIALRQPSCVFYSAVMWLNPISDDAVRRDTCCYLIFKNLLRCCGSGHPMSAPTFTITKVNTRCYRFKSWGCDGLSLGVYFEPFTRTEVTIFSRSNCQN